MTWEQIQFNSVVLGRSRNLRDKNICVLDTTRGKLENMFWLNRLFKSAWGEMPQESLKKRCQVVLVCPKEAVNSKLMAERAGLTSISSLWFEPAWLVNVHFTNIAGFLRILDQTLPFSLCFSPPLCKAASFDSYGTLLYHCCLHLLLMSFINPQHWGFWVFFCLIQEFKQWKIFLLLHFRLYK